MIGCLRMSASRQSLRFILSLRLYSIYITSRPEVGLTLHNIIMLSISASPDTNPKMCHLRPTMNQIWMGIHPIWSKSSLFARIDSYIRFPQCIILIPEWANKQTDLSFCWMKYYMYHLVDSVTLFYILKDFENASPRLNPLFHKPWECQRDNCYCIS